jgi:flagellar assembly protein FliH
MGAAVSPIAEFQYRQLLPAIYPLSEGPLAEVEQAAPEQAAQDPRLAEEDVRRRIAAERAAAVADTESRLRLEYEQRSTREAGRISLAVENFQQTQKDYFARVEAEVVQLALAIAAKILHREAQVDPMLIAALVQIALGQMKEGSVVTLRVAAGEAARWQSELGKQTVKVEVSIVEDAGLDSRDCVLETELGAVNFNLDMQLKEVEKGFFDVLAQRPQL